MRLPFVNWPKWRSNQSQDLAAILAAKESIDSGYSALTNNCVDTVRDALDAAGVFYESSFGIPQIFFAGNQDFAEELNYSDFELGLVE